MIIVDSREQNPLFEKDVIVRGLKTGDYSIVGYEDEISIERKSVPDAIQSVLKDRERFQKEMERARKFKYFAIVVEGTISDLKKEITRQWSINNRIREKKIKNKGYLIGMLKSVPNTYRHWSVKYNYPVFFCKNRVEAKETIKELLNAYVKYKDRGEI